MGGREVEEEGVVVDRRGAVMMETVMIYDAFDLLRGCSAWRNRFLEDLVEYRNQMK